MSWHSQFHNNKHFSYDFTLNIWTQDLQTYKDTHLKMFYQSFNRIGFVAPFFDTSVTNIVESRLFEQN